MKYVRVIVAFIYLATCAGDAFAWWDEIIPKDLLSSGSPYLSEKEKLEQQKKTNEEAAAQNKAVTISKYLEKAREERNRGNFRAARDTAERALKADDTNYKVKAFLDYLATEEDSFREEWVRQKEELEAKKREKEEARRSAQKEKEEARRLVQEEKEEARRKILEEKEKEKAEKEIPVKETQAAEPTIEEKPQAQVGSAPTEEKPQEPMVRIPKELQVESDKDAIKKLAGERLKEKEEEVKERIEKGEVKRLTAEEEVERWRQERQVLAQKAEEPKKEKPSDEQEEKLLDQLKGDKPIIVDGDKVEYFEKEQKIVAEGNVVVVYGETKLTCDRIEVDTRSRAALCDGNVVIEQPGEGTLTGERIQYDFAQKTGKVVGGEVEAYPWYGSAEDSRRVGKNEFLLKKGYITTCDLDHPHYRIKGREIRVFPNDLIIAKDVVFEVADTPLMYWPHYFHPIIQSRAKVQFIPGRSSEWGYYLLSAWRFIMFGNTRFDALLDYRDRKGFAEGANIYYNTKDIGAPGLGEGIVRLYYIQQNAKNTRDPDEYRDYGHAMVARKRIQWKHRLDFDEDTVGMLQFNKVSDENVIKDYFYDEYRQNRQQNNDDSFISLISTKDNYLLSIEATKRFHDFYNVTQKLPEIKLDIPNQSLWNTPFYYTNTMSVANFHKVYAKPLDGTPTQPYFRSNISAPSELVSRFDTFYKLSYVADFKWFNLIPYGAFRETLYSRNRWGDKLIDRAVVEGGLDASSRLYRLFNFNTNFLWLDINKIRHIIAPSAQYLTRHQPTVDINNLYQMDGIDGLEKENRINFSLENKLQTKRHVGDALQPVDLARVIISTDYHFRLRRGRFFEAKDTGPDRKHGRFRNLKFDIELLPYDWLFIDTEIVVTPKNQAISTGSCEVAITPGEFFQASAGYEYEKRMPEPRQDFTFDFTWKINPKWRVGLYERIDWSSKIIDEQQISITRDLHCWQVDLVYDVQGSRFFRDQYDLWLAFTIKAFPDLPIGLRQTFRKRLPGRLSPREKAQSELSGG